MKKIIGGIFAFFLVLFSLTGFAQAANATVAPSYDVVLWQTDTYNVKYPQTKVSVTSSSTVTLPAIPTTCGTSWQGDVYVHSEAEWAWLSATTSLAGPDGAQDSAFLAPGGNNVAYIYVVNPPCVEEPEPPVTVGPQMCTVSGALYTESDDHAAVKTDAGYQFTSAGDKKATGLLLPVSTNAQNITNISFTTENTVGNGIFFRFIFDLSADGGPAYGSFSVSDTNTINQSSVAGVGSKNVLLGKTLAQVAEAYPHNKIVAMGWQTGSSYAAGDGALLTGYTGDCGSASFLKGAADPVPPTEVKTGDGSELLLFLPSSALLAMAGIIFLVTRRKEALNQ